MFLQQPSAVIKALMDYDNVDLFSQVSIGHVPYLLLLLLISILKLEHLLERFMLAEHLARLPLDHSKIKLRINLNLFILMFGMILECD